MQKIWAIFFSAVAIASLCSEGFADYLALGKQLLPPDLEQASDGAPGGLVKVAPWTANHTRILYNRGESNEIIPRGAAYVFIFLVGTGGNRAKGIEQTVGPVAEELFRKTDGKAAVIALENPIYFMSDRSLSERQPWLQKYSEIGQQMNWLYRTLHYLDPIIGKQRRRGFVGRSTGAVLGGQAEHDYLRSVPGSDVIGKFDELLLTGIVGTEPDEIKQWYLKEHLLRRIEPETQDVPVVDLGPRLIGGTTFARPGQFYSNNVLSVPRTRLVISGRDSFTAWQRQEIIYERFAQNNPTADITRHYMDSAHDLARAGSYKIKNGEGSPKRINVKKNERLLRHLLEMVQAPPSKPVLGRRAVVRHPEWENIAQIIDPCPNILAPEDYEPPTEVPY